MDVNFRIRYRSCAGSILVVGGLSGIQAFVVNDMQIRYGNIDQRGQVVTFLW